LWSSEFKDKYILNKSWEIRQKEESKKKRKQGKKRKRKAGRKKHWD
jgi:hypothetical protein